MPSPETADPLADLRGAVIETAHELGSEDAAGLTLERPPKRELGDYSTNAAMMLAGGLRAAPREIAERLRPALAERLGRRAERIEVAGPGFLNLFMSVTWHREATAAMLAAGDGRGRNGAGEPERVLLEFVSANPTGPVTVASGRGAAYGDSLARVLEFNGHAVVREYYLNDAGSQIELFARSIAARMQNEEPPEDGYAGEYVGELAEELAGAGATADDLDTLARQATESMRTRIEASLERFGVHFDVWSSERELRESGAPDRTVEALSERGHVYRSEGALWLRTTEFGDDKDRVLIRGDGEPTYFAPDIAYHLDKLDRADRLIDVLGADHHGYVPRMRAALAALGRDPECFEAAIMQMVSVVESGQRSRMSKRKGDFVTLDELVDDIGADAARFFMLQRSHDSTVDLDLELARSQSQENPVYYVQYAHARISSILRKAAQEGAAGAGDPAAIAAAAASDEALAAAAEASELALVRRLLELPGEVRAAAERRGPHRLCAYAMATAADFHAFYRDCRVVGAEPEVEAARLGLSLAAARTIATTLGLLGISAPERM